jgi:hypothetical protein
MEPPRLRGFVGGGRGGADCGVDICVEDDCGVDKSVETDDDWGVIVLWVNQIRFN